MIVNKEIIEKNNEAGLPNHKRNFEFISSRVSNVENIIKKIN